MLEWPSVVFTGGLGDNTGTQLRDRNMVLSPRNRKQPSQQDQPGVILMKGTL